jgi:hypothetical protein
MRLMFASSRAPFRASSPGFLKPVLVLSLAALLAACSNTKQPVGPQVFSWLAPEPPPPAPVVQAEVELEDDGLPPQADPVAGIRRMPDDPSAPWSPNYGRSAAGAGDIAARGSTPVSEWTADTRGAMAPVVGAEDDGLPPIKSPEEAGVMVQPPPRRMQGASLASPWRTCSSAESWKCGR